MRFEDHYFQNLHDHPDNREDHDALLWSEFIFHIFSKYGHIWIRPARIQLIYPNNRTIVNSDTYLYLTSIPLNFVRMPSTIQNCRFHYRTVSTINSNIVQYCPRIRKALSPKYLQVVSFQYILKRLDTFDVQIFDCAYNEPSPNSKCLFVVFGDQWVHLFRTILS